MTQARIDFFARLTREEKERLSADDFTVSEFKEIVCETAFTEIEKMIAIHRYVDCMTYEQISEKIGIDLRTCRSKMPKVDEKLKNTYLKLFYR